MGRKVLGGDLLEKKGWHVGKHWRRLREVLVIREK